MKADPEVYRRLGRETGSRLAELGVRPEDSRWIRAHAESIAGLAGERPIRPLGERMQARLRALWRSLRDR